MIVLYCVGGLLACVLLLLCIPIGFRFRFDGKAELHVRILGIRVRLYPQKQADNKSEIQEAVPEPSRKKKPIRKRMSLLEQEGVGGIVTLVRDIAETVSKAAKRMLRAVVLRRLTLSLRLADGDAAETALLYGKTCAVLYPSLGMLCSLLRIRKQQLEIVPDWNGDTSSVFVDVRGHICPLRVVWAVLCAAVSLIISLVSQSGKDTVKEVV